MSGHHPPPQSWATPQAPKADPARRLAFGCVGAGCLAFAGIVALICFVAFLDHYGFINDNLIKTVRRCRTFGC